jgi:hypothetical protein
MTGQCTCTITDAGGLRAGDVTCPVHGDAAEEARAERGERLARDWFLPPAAAEYARELGPHGGARHPWPLACPWEAPRPVDHPVPAGPRLGCGFPRGQTGTDR